MKLSVFEAEMPVWRRIRVRGGTSLRGLNRVIRRVFGWPVSHEYTLRVRRPWERGADEAMVSRRRVRVGDAVGEGDSLSLSYEYGQGWWVDAVVERGVIAKNPVPAHEFPRAEPPALPGELETSLAHLEEGLAARDLALSTRKSYRRAVWDLLASYLARMIERSHPRERARERVE